MATTYLESAYPTEDAASHTDTLYNLVAQYCFCHGDFGVYVVFESLFEDEPTYIRGADTGE